MTTPFLWGLGTTNNGLLVAALSLLTTELNSLASGSVVLSSVGGSSGKFTNADTGGAIRGEIELTLGAIGSTLAAGAVARGWFVKSLDSGSSYEKASVALARPADFIIPLPTTTISAGDKFTAFRRVEFPSVQFKVLLANEAGQTWASSGNDLKAGLVSVQF